MGRKRVFGLSHAADMSGKQSLSESEEDSYITLVSRYVERRRMAYPHW